MIYFSLYFHITVHRQKKSGQELKKDKTLEAEMEAVTTEECCLLACCPWFAFLYHPAARTQD